MLFCTSIGHSAVYSIAGGKETYCKNNTVLYSAACSPEQKSKPIESQYTVTEVQYCNEIQYSTLYSSIYSIGPAHAIFFELTKPPPIDDRCLATWAKFLQPIAHETVIFAADPCKILSRCIAARN